MARETWAQSQVESYQRLKKCYLMPPCLALSIIRYGLRVKWVNTGKGVAPFPTSWYNSYRKGSLRVTLNCSCQLYLLFLQVQIFCLHSQMPKQFYFKQFGLALVRCLNVKTVLVHSFNAKKQFYFKQFRIAYKN